MGKLDELNRKYGVQINGGQNNSASPSSSKLNELNKKYGVNVPATKKTEEATPGATPKSKQKSTQKKSTVGDKATGIFAKVFNSAMDTAQQGMKYVESEAPKQDKTTQKKASTDTPASNKINYATAINLGLGPISKQTTDSLIANGEAKVDKNGTVISKAKNNKSETVKSAETTPTAVEKFYNDLKEYAKYTSRNKDKSNDATVNKGVEDALGAAKRELLSAKQDAYQEKLEKLVEPTATVMPYIPSPDRRAYGERSTLTVDTEESMKEKYGVNYTSDMYPFVKLMSGWEEFEDTFKHPEKYLPKGPTAEEKRAALLKDVGDYMTGIYSKQDFSKYSKYLPRTPKTEKQFKEDGYKKNEAGQWYKITLAGPEFYHGEDDDVYIYINEPSKRDGIDNKWRIQYGSASLQEFGYGELTNEEKAVYNYLYYQDRENGTNEADKFLKMINQLLQERAMATEAKRLAKITKEGEFIPSLYSVGTNFADMMMFPTKVTALLTGGYDEAPWLNTYTNKTQAIRSAAVEDNGVWGTRAYNAGMSLLDMSTALLAAGGNGKLTQAIMSSSAGSSTISTAKANGASDEKALLMGLGSAGIEWATEKYSIEAILKKPETILGYITTNIVTEGSEEGVSNIANSALDDIVSAVFDEPSEIENRIKYLVEHEGKTEKEAMEIAFNEKMQSLKDDIWTGALSGGGMSSVTVTPTAVQRVAEVRKQNSYADAIINDKESLNALIKKGKAGGTGSESRKIAKEVEKSKKSGNVTRTQVKSLIKAIDSTIQAAEQTLQSEITKAERKAALASTVSERTSGFDKTSIVNEAIKKAATEYVAESRKRNIVNSTYLDAVTLTGEKVSIDDVKKATAYGDNGAQVLADAINTTGVRFSEVKNDVHNYYEAGLINKPVKLENDLQQEMYYAGKKDRTASKIKATEGIFDNRVYNTEQSGLITPESTNKGDLNPAAVPESVSPKMAKALDMVGKALGKKVMFVEDIVVNGQSDAANARVRSSGVFEISVKSDNPLYELIMHEPVHIMRMENTKEYHDFVNFAVEHAEALGYGIEKRNSLGTAFDSLHDAYTKRGLDIEADALIEEIAARFAETLVKGEQDAIDLINKMNQKAETRTALKKFADVFKKLIEKLKKLWQRLKDNGEYTAARELNKTISDLEKAKKLYEKAYRATQKSVESRLAMQEESDAKAHVETKKAERKAEIERVKEGLDSNRVEKAKAERKAEIEKSKERLGYTKSSKSLEIKINEEYNGNESYSLKTGKYTEQEYLNYGWVRANDVLNAGEYSNFTSKFADAVEQKFIYPKSKRGEYIIPVSDINEPIFRGTENVLVFAEGKIDNPVINSVIRIYEYDEEVLNNIRGFIYGSESAGVHQESCLSFSRYYSNDFRFSEARQANVLSSVKNSEGNGVGKGNSGENSRAKGNSKVDYSLEGSEYLELAKNPKQNEARLREMVDEAAKDAGYDIPAYHGTPNNDFTVFDKNRVGKGTDQYGAGFYFASNKDAARAYGSRVIDSLISLKNPIKIDGSSDEGANLIDAGFNYLLTEEQAYEVIKRLPDIYDPEESPLGDYFDSYWETGAEEWMIEELAASEFNRNIGYLDSDLFRNYPNELHEALRDVIGYDGVEVTFENGDRFYVGWFDNQMKSAEPVTYDDDGNVIPLEERFNDKKEDIRYSLKDSKGNTLSKEQQDFFKDSKVRDENGNLLVVYHGTSADFSVFEKGHKRTRGSLSFGDGFYFTSKKSMAEMFTEGEKARIITGYLNVKKPYNVFGTYFDKDDFSNVATELGNGREVNKNNITECLKELGYDGIIVRNYNGIDNPISTVVVFNSEQAKLTTTKKPTSNPDINLSLKGGIKINPEGRREMIDTVEEVRTGKASVDKLSKYVDSGMIRTEEYDALVQKYGAIYPGENPHRDVEVPRKTSKDKKVSQTVRTILEAKATPDTLVPTIEKMVEDGVFSYDVYTDKQAIQDAEDMLKEYGWLDTYTTWKQDVEDGIVSKQHTVQGWALYNNAVNRAAEAADTDAKRDATQVALDVLDMMVRHQRNAAQALQATRVLKKLEPDAQLYGIQKSVNAFQKELEAKYGKKAPKLKVDEELAEKFLNAETQEERDKATREIYKDIGRQMPSSFMDRWNAWRYLAMLGNPRTHVRNIFGNLFFAPVVATKNLTATAIESIVAPVARLSGKKMVRGKSLVLTSKSGRALLKAAWSDYANVADAVSGEGKYNDSAVANKSIEEGRKIFKSKLFAPLEWARRGNSKALEVEDVWFSRPHYAYALAQYCNANNITAEQIAKGKAIAPAREYAIREAQKATYKDTNAFSQFVSEIGRKSHRKNAVTKAVSTVVEGILPFRKTPANILVRGVEYSPLGLLKGLTRDLYKVAKGEMNAHEAIDNISAGLTGTGLLALGVYLAAQGLVRGHGEDDEDERKFKEMQGHQAYSLELPNGTSVTLDWLAPEALPFFVGVNIYETTKGSDEKVNMSSILSSVTRITEPMMEMSCLQGVNDMIESVGGAYNNDTSSLMAMGASAVTSYLSQGVPTLFGQIERTSEEKRMTTYTDKNDFLTGDMQYLLGKQSAKIPGWDYGQIPYIDAWGRKEASGYALKRGLNNFLNPAYTSEIESTATEKELLRLYEQTGDASVFPERADKYFTVDGKRKDLTADEYVMYATKKGENSYKLVTELIESDAYKKLDDGEKVKAIKDAYDYANQKAKAAISKYKPDAWVGEADKFKNKENFISFRASVSDTRKDNGGKITKDEVIDIILGISEDNSEAWKMYLSQYDSETALKIKNKGVAAEDYMAYVKGIEKAGSDDELTKSEVVDVISRINVDDDTAWALYLSKYDSTSVNYAKNNGIKGNDYMEFLEALDVVDKPTESGKYGTYTQDEATNAIKRLKGLSQKEKAILWQSVNTKWKDKNNPFK